MKKSHEKSEIVRRNNFDTLDKLSENGYIVLQVETMDQKSGYLCEFVRKSDYDRTTAEGRAEELEKQPEDERAEHKREVDDLNARIEAAEETLSRYMYKPEDLERENRNLRAVIAEIEEYGSIPESARCMMQDIEEGKEVNKHMF